MKLIKIVSFVENTLTIKSYFRFSTNSTCQYMWTIPQPTTLWFFRNQTLQEFCWGFENIPVSIILERRYRTEKTLGTRRWTNIESMLIQRQGVESALIPCWFNIDWTLRRWINVDIKLWVCWEVTITDIWQKVLTSKSIIEDLYQGLETQTSGHSDRRVTVAKGWQKTHVTEYNMN